MLPYFSGERTPIHDPHAKGVIFGLDLTHSRGDLYRAVLEGIAYGTRHVFETYREAGQEPRTIFAVGGGTKNPVWAQATSDMSGHSRRSAREDPRRLLRRRVSGGAGGRRRQTGDIEAWNPSRRRSPPRRPALPSMTSAMAWAFKEEAVSRTRDLMRRLG